MDDIFWNQKIPKLFAEQKSIPFEEAQRIVLSEYEEVGRDTPQWYIPEYWLERFGITADVEKILAEINYASEIFEDARIIEQLSSIYRIVICTNNPRSILEHKLRIAAFTKDVYKTFSSVSDYGSIVKNMDFFLRVCKDLSIEPNQMLHIGDDPVYDYREPVKAGVNAILIVRQNNKSNVSNLYDIATILRIST